MAPDEPPQLNAHSSDIFPSKKHDTDIMTLLESPPNAPMYLLIHLRASLSVKNVRSERY